MKIAVMADSHDNLANLERAIARANEEQCAHLLHLGDIVAPFTAQRLREFKGLVRAVFGNNDGEKLGLQRAFTTFGGTIENPPLKLELAGRKIAMMHDPFLIEEVAKSHEMDYIFYGHLHKARLQHYGRTTTLNPGDLSGWMAEPTFYIVDLAANECQKIKIGRK